MFVRASGGRRSVGDGAGDGALADRELAQRSRVNLLSIDHSDQKCEVAFARFTSGMRGLMARKASDRNQITHAQSSSPTSYAAAVVHSITCSLSTFISRQLYVYQNPLTFRLSTELVRTSCTASNPTWTRTIWSQRYPSRTALSEAATAIEMETLNQLVSGSYHYLAAYAYPYPLIL